MTTQLHPKLPAMPGEGVWELTTFQNVTTSTSDRKYSFGRESRFPSLKHQGTDNLCYESPTSRSRRATNLGVGERFKSPRYFKEKRPSPASYHIPSVFNPDQTIASFASLTTFQKGKKTHCFGAGREDFKKTVVNRESRYTDPNNPGPSDYLKEKPFGSTSVSFSLSYKIDFDHDTTVALKRNHPAPGHYEDVAQLDKQGSYSVSFYRNSGARLFGREMKLPPNVMEAAQFPGPGYHEHTGNMSAGFQPVSSFRTIATRTFGNEGRPDWVSRFQTPGPAAYLSPSDFGYLTLSPTPQSSTKSKHDKTRRIYAQKPIALKFPAHKMPSTRESKAQLTSPPSQQNTTHATSGPLNVEQMLSENDALSPRNSREVPFGDFELQPKKTIAYNYHGGSNRAIGRNRNLPSPGVGKQGAGKTAHKNGTEMTMKGEPLAGPLYNSDQNTTQTNFQSLQSMPRDDVDHNQTDSVALMNRSGPATLDTGDRGRNTLVTIQRDHSTKDTAQNQSIGYRSGEIDNTHEAQSPSFK